MAVPAVGRSQVPPQFQPAASVAPPVAPGVGSAPSSLASASEPSVGSSFFSHMIAGFGAFLSYIFGSSLANRQQEAPAERVFYDENVITKILAQLTPDQKALFEELDVKDQENAKIIAFGNYDFHRTICEVSGFSAEKTKEMVLPYTIASIREIVAEKFSISEEIWPEVALPVYTNIRYRSKKKWFLNPMPFPTRPKAGIQQTA